MKDGSLLLQNGVVSVLQPGIYTGITQEQYRNGIGLSNSQLGLLMKSPRALWFSEMKRKQGSGTTAKPAAMLLSDEDEKRNAALVFGSAMHKLVLEPETWDDEFAVIPADAPRRVTERERGALKPSHETIARMGWWDDFTYNNVGKQLLTSSEYKKMWSMYEALREHWFEYEGARIPTIALFQNGHAESSMYWVDPDTGVLCKGRPDYMSQHFIADYKTTTDGSEYGFQRSMADFGYYRQAPFYLDGMRHAGGADHQNFAFVVQEKKEPYEVFVYAIGNRSCGIGRDDYKRLLRRYVENQTQYGEIGKGQPWPMACSSIRDIELPQWAMYQGGLIL